MGLEEGGLAEGKVQKCPVGSEPNAACGGCSEVSEWQRSIKSRSSVSPKILSGTATGTGLTREIKIGSTGEQCVFKDYLWKILTLPEQNGILIQ